MRLKNICFTFLIFFASCLSGYLPQTIEYAQYQVKDSLRKDIELLKLIKPYSDSVVKSMSDIVGYLSGDLEKSSPNGSLGYFMTDVMLSAAQTKVAEPVDAAILNAGGIRLQRINAGSLTRGKFFELSPFENLIVILKMPGKVLQELLDHSAHKGGWPIAGISYKLENRKAVDVKINQLPLDASKLYAVAMPDYLANGGDDAGFLRAIKQESLAIIFRDALIDHVAEQQKKGIKIFVKKETRIEDAK